MLLSLWSLVNKDHMVHGMLPLEYNHYVVRKPRPRGGATTGQRPQLGLLWHKHCFLGRLIRSPGVPKERGVGVLEEEIGVWNSQGGGKDNFFFFFSTFLGLINIKCVWVFFFFFFSLSLERMITQLNLNSVKERKWKKVAQSCPTLCDPMDYSLPGSSIHGIFQARILEWIAISFCRRSSRPRDSTQISRIVGRHFTIWATRKGLTQFKLC